MRIFGLIILTESKFWSLIIDPLYPMLESFRDQITYEVKKKIDPIADLKDYARPYTNQIEDNL